MTSEVFFNNNNAQCFIIKSWLGRTTSIQKRSLCIYVLAHLYGKGLEISVVEIDGFWVGFVSKMTFRGCPEVAELSRDVGVTRGFGVVPRFRGWHEVSKLSRDLGVVPRFQDCPEVSGLSRGLWFNLGTVCNRRTGGLYADYRIRNEKTASDI